MIMRDNVDSYFAGDCTVAKEAKFEKNKILTLLDLSSVDFDKIDEVSRFAGNLINFGDSFGKRYGSKASVALNDNHLLYN